MRSIILLTPLANERFPFLVNEDGNENEHGQRPAVEQEVLLGASLEWEQLGGCRLRPQPERARYLGRVKSILSPGLLDFHEIFPGSFPFIAGLLRRTLLKRNATPWVAAQHRPEH